MEKQVDTEMETAGLRGHIVPFKWVIWGSYSNIPKAICYRKV